MFREKKNNSYGNIFFVAVWNKIIRSSIVKAHPFSQENNYEDIAFTKNIYSYMDRFGFSRNAYYIWDNRIRNTEGTLSCKYSNNNVEMMNKYYMDALFYCVKNGNSQKMEYLIYDTLKEVYTFFSQYRIQIGSNTFNMFLNEIIELHKKSDILKNRFVKDDSELSDYYQFLLTFKTE